ncbi:MAG: hypothetical protein CVV02_09045 [Firmicutes bacterium HGW-Firmicutes-7]|nr:MAG: hypothetical protein CVV02_09045 [Firmicutes bacterium HGW-Firmicutes-7]
MKNNRKSTLFVIALLLIATVTSLIIGSDLKATTTSQKANVIIGTEKGKEIQEDDFKFPTINSKNHIIELIKSNIELNEQFYYSPTMSMEDSGDMLTEKSSSLDTNTTEFSGTNNQVDGVEEGDVIQTDGSYIYKVDQYKNITIINANPNNPQIVSTIKIDGNMNISELFLANGKLIVIANSYGYAFPLEGEVISNKIAIDVSFPRYRGNDETKVLIYSLVDISKPTLEKDYSFDGLYVSGRTIGSSLYFVTNKNMYYDWYTILEDNNMVKDEMLLPSYTDYTIDEKVTLAYKDIRYFPDFTEPSYMITVGIEMKNLDIKPDVQAYLGTSGTIYVSNTQLFTTITKYDLKNTGTNYNTSTQIYQYDLKDGRITASGKGEVQGTIVNQFSMDAYKDYFRITTTTGFTWDEVNPSKNNLYILDSKMKTVGKIEGLAEGERIYSTRFMGDKVYMVTFKQVDPLFVIDASNPTKPEVLGYLKIPGFSEYLHPVDENHLLGFGYDTKVEGDRVTTGGLKLSLFDVTNPLKPIEKQNQIIGNQGSYSELLWNHKALMYAGNQELMAFPVQLTGDNYNIEFTGAMVYSINSNGFKQKGNVSHYNSGTQYDQYKVHWDYAINRILYIEGYLYTLSEGKLQVYDAETIEFVSELTL